MTRKDCDLVAEALRQSHPMGPKFDQRFADLDTGTMLIAWLATRNELADSLFAANPRFDANRFYAACQP